MKKLSKKRLRDIRQNKMQFFNIFIMVFLGVFVFAGIHAYMDGMEKSADNYYKNNNFQDIWLSGENFSNEDLEKVKSHTIVYGHIVDNENIIDEVKNILR